MEQAVLSQEPIVRLSAFVGVLVAMALWEARAPRRLLAAGRARRWPGNLGVLVVATLLVRVLLPAGVVGFAVIVQARGWGLLPAAGMPFWAAVLIAVVLLDLLIYCQHVLFHAVPALWRLHRMHHADLDMDVTTGVRFHPAEILLSIGIKLGAVAALGPPPLAVLLFEVLLNASSLFSHGNIRMPGALDPRLRWLVVTPDMHRVHHSAVPSETNSNFGFNLSCWDRLFGTYRRDPAAGHHTMTIGLEDFRDERQLRLDRLLVQPFVGGRGRYPIGERSAAP
jgi:sterol desaturase/sphingolipid hydroxylase (fatty acid hydroxylase superfamily)